MGKSKNIKNQKNQTLKTKYKNIYILTLFLKIIIKIMAIFVHILNIRFFFKITITHFIVFNNIVIWSKNKMLILIEIYYLF